jgi:ribosomal protein S18 acetylase RimI-like enzyme
MSQLPSAPGTTLRWRSTTDADTALLQRIYTDARAAELHAVGWPDVTIAAFCRQQHDFQQLAYRAQHPGARCWVIEGGPPPEPLGRLWVDEDEAALHLLDISLLTAHRGAGVGSRCLRRLQVRAHARGLPLRLHVRWDNPARALYRRLGFVEGTQDGLHLAMQWLPEPATLAGAAVEILDEQA